MLFNCPAPMQVDFYQKVPADKKEEYLEDWPCGIEELQFVDKIGVFSEKERKEIAKRYEKYSNDKAVSCALPTTAYKRLHQ